ncbi:MAG: hypothetical protein M0R37_15515 [Bacteroidales bacterium]|nr:hypothetical protein [Bacteroidales bacterium]
MAINIDFDPAHYNSWQIIAFEVVTNNSFIDALTSVDGRVRVSFSTALALAWVQAEPPEPTLTDKQLTIAFRTYAAKIPVTDLFDAFGTEEEEASNEADPTVAEEAPTETTS